MNITRRRGAIALAITLGVLIIGGLITFYIPWVLLNERSIMLFIVGLVLLGLLVAGVVLNTVFLVREVRRNERQDSFLNAVTHELKTPIASIRLYLETLQRREIPEEQRQDFYRIMLADTGRLLSTVEQVLKAGELNARSRHQNRTLLEIAPMISDCIAITLERHHLPEEAVRLEPVPGGVRLRVRGIAEDLRTAILNILDNAVKYSPSGVHVRCSLAIVNFASVRLAISDQGVGLPPGQDKQIFKRFYRVPGRMAVKIKGTGIGLFLVRTIIRQHGGEVKAGSAGLNQGTTITVTLPIAASLPAESVVPSTRAEVSQ
ncbi:MAG TPA: HAMP domain-containing sensor histidine kinase [Acidobacteriaceae bacterium]|jgi:signal transduction histidine kinase|nr:HAMP domain-containing sensor histidine kinase [Acidobacteriaceae bacterium]